MERGGSLMSNMDKIREAKEEAKEKRPHFYLGPYELKTDGMTYYFIDKTGKCVSGYYGSPGVALIRALARYDVMHNHDLTGEADVFIEKFRVAVDKFSKMVLDAERRLRPILQGEVKE
jgi:hypothetical protein